MLPNLEFFILALVESGMTTSYDLMAKAGISVGSSLPILKHLERSNLIKRFPVGARKAVRFTILEAGMDLLSNELEQQLEARFSDLDSTLRLACLAWMKKSRKHYAMILMESATILRSRRKWASAEAKELAGRESELTAGERYHWLKVSLEAHRLQAEASVLGELSRSARSKISGGRPQDKKSKINKM
jgi:hypothetical protein